MGFSDAYIEAKMKLRILAEHNEDVKKLYKALEDYERSMTQVKAPRFPEINDEFVQLVAHFYKRLIKKAKGETVQEDHINFKEDNFMRMIEARIVAEAIFLTETGLIREMPWRIQEEYIQLILDNSEKVSKIWKNIHNEEEY